MIHPIIYPRHKTHRSLTILLFLLATLAGPSVQAALIEFSSATVALRGFGGGFTGNASFSIEEAPELGTTEYLFAVSKDDFGRPDLPPFAWISTFIEDTVTTTLSDTEISMRQTGIYGNRGPGVEVNNTLGFSHRLNVVFEVKDQPVVIELFHFRNTVGSRHGSGVSLMDYRLGTELAYASDGAHFDRVRNTISSAPTQMMLAPNLYELQIETSDFLGDIGIAGSLTPWLNAGLRFVATVPEPTTLSLFMVGALVLLCRRTRRSGPVR